MNFLQERARELERFRDNLIDHVGPDTLKAIDDALWLLNAEAAAKDEDDDIPF